MIMEIKVNDYLTWQGANINARSLKMTQPIAVSKSMPQHWKSLPGNLDEALHCPVHGQEIIDAALNKSARHCLGLRGAQTVGYTIPMPVDMDFDEHNIYVKNFYDQVREPNWPECSSLIEFYALPEWIQHECENLHQFDATTTLKLDYPWLQIVDLHPEMLHGSCWTETKQDGTYRWKIKVLVWPWRAKMPRGWRMMITGHPFDWSRSWHAFTGCVDANYRHDGRNVGDFWQYQYDIEKDFCYFNVETVIAFDTENQLIKKSQCLFSLIPLWDPDYVPKRPKKKTLLFPVKSIHRP